MGGEAFLAVFPGPTSQNDPKQTILEKNLQQLWANPVRCQDALIILQKTVELLQDLGSRLIANGGSAAYQARIVPRREYANTLALVIYATAVCALGLKEDSKRIIRGLSSSSQNSEKALLGLIHALESVGLGGDCIDLAWASAVDKLLSQYVVQLNSVNNEDAIVDAVNRHIDSTLIPWIAIFEKPRKQPGKRTVQHAGKSSRVDAATVGLLKSTALSRIGRLKAQKLCDDLVAGEASIASNERDFLTHHLASPHARHELAAIFESQLHAQVLHSGLSTVAILSIYMRLITHFRMLDPSGIVLRRLASPMQSFLRTRPDAVRIILLSLLEQPHQSHSQHSVSGTSSYCAAIARCMDDERMADFREYHEGMDLEDEKWMPEPVDAATGHQGHRNLDAIAHLVAISSREAFMSELQDVLAGRLLQRKGRDVNFSREIRLLNLFKQRFEELGIQSCEVMVRDVLASQTLNKEIREAVMPQVMGEKCDFDALVLSKYYWPTLQTGAFVVPDVVKQKREQYQTIFKRKKGRRKLEFLDTLGRAHVVLELQDRTVEVDCAPYQAAVIYAFQNSDGKRSVNDLVRSLRMDDDLVHQALLFWESQHVLRPSPDRTSFAVLERLPSTSAGTPVQPSTPTAVPAPPALATPPVKKPEDLLNENKDLYSRVVETMLTNQGGMPASRILSMMKMVLPAGFPFEERELRVRLLEDLERKGKVECGGDGVWRVRR